MNLPLIFALLFTSAWAAPANRQLHYLVDSGALPGLHWPNFTRLQPDVARFYELNDYRLAWVRSGTITPQAHALMGVLQNAALKGLDPDDYDGVRWNGSEAGYERFDLALTVSAMRYMSDVSSGKVDPAVFSFGLHFDQKKCDLAGTLRTLMSARDVAVELDPIEPPFEGYWRTQKALAKYLELARQDAASPDQPTGPAGVKRRLRMVGDLGPNDTFVNGVKRFQTRHGLDPDGPPRQNYAPGVEHAARRASASIAVSAGTLALGAAFVLSSAHCSEHPRIPAACL